MQFTEDAMPGIVDGSTTVTFRRLEAGPGQDRRPPPDPGRADRGRRRPHDRRCEHHRRRCPPIWRVIDQAVLDRPGDCAEGPIWRIEFHRVGPDDRIARRSTISLDPDERAAIQHRLDRMDRSGASGPWTTKTLRLIGTYPGMVTTALARQLGQARPAFKLNVRKLKQLGLTESLEVGYRLSPLGEAFTGVATDPQPGTQ